MRVILYSKKAPDGFPVDGRNLPALICDEVTTKGRWRGECPACQCGNKIVLSFYPLNEGDMEFLGL